MDAVMTLNEMIEQAKEVDLRLRQAIRDAEDARRFEVDEPTVVGVLDGDVLARLRKAARARAAAEAEVFAAVSAARKRGVSWNLIGAAIGTSGEAVRTRYRNRLDG
jgi:hypothetical protein